MAVYGFIARQHGLAEFVFALWNAINRVQYGSYPYNMYGSRVDPWSTHWVGQPKYKPLPFVG